MDAEQVAPFNKDGHPDLLNYMPTRFVPLDEAKTRGWSHFFEGAPCRYGHRAPRYVSNPRLCVDCFRIQRGKAPLSAATPRDAEYKPRQYTQRKPAAAGPASVAAPTAPEPDRLEKQFLAHYAAQKDLDGAAMACGITGSQILARLSWSKVFAEALAKLEDDLGITHVVFDTGPFEWTDEKRTRLLEVYVDTGDIATARDAIRVTPSEYFRELERNLAFAALLQEKEPLASLALEERAVQLSLAGNDKLLLRVLGARKPEYRERMNVDMNVTEKLTDEQLDAQLARLLPRYAGEIFDGEFTVLDVPQGQAPALPNPARESETRQPESNLDLL